MVSKLIHVSLHEVDNQLELSLRQAYKTLKPKLNPPFSLQIPNPQEYLQLNKALLYVLLTDSHSCKTRIKHLHAIVTDGYSLFTSLLIRLIVELYPNLVDSVKVQLVCVTKEMINVSSVGVDDLLVTLLRRIESGDVWFCNEIVSLFLDHWGCLVAEFPLVLCSGLYCFLHRGLAELENVKRFCVKMFIEEMSLCLSIGRELVRLLHGLVHVSEFKEMCNDFVCSEMRTSSRYFLLRISYEMETQLRFLLGNVKLGSHKRYQIWFFKKFLLGVEKETVLVDIVRFICCVIHPSNEVIRSEIMRRWAVLGWLLELSMHNYRIERSFKLALFYDWLFFDEKKDNIMNVEPAALLMVWSMTQYPHITHSLLEFLLCLVDTYDTRRKDIIVRGVASAFREIERKGVIRSLDIFLSNPSLAPDLKQKLSNLLATALTFGPSLSNVVLKEL